jgi:regulation of enolase protein 1 (concanavalin A-like superfamily)
MSEFRSIAIARYAALGLLATQIAGAATPLATPPKGPLSSSFPGPLWSLVAPKGGTAQVSNAHLFLKVPGGSNHDPLATTNQAVRLVQPVGNVNFDVAIKVDSAVVASDADTSSGLIVVADDKNYVTFGISTNGTNVTLSAHQVNQGTPATLFEHAGFTEYQNPLFLRINRNGAAYIAYYSVDGNVWTQAGTFSFEQAPTAVGPFAGNSNANPARAVPVVVAINWFNVL